MTTSTTPQLITPLETAPFNVREARFNMIEQQIRTWEVLDPKVLDLLNEIPREDFVPDTYKGLAFADLEIPLGNGQMMLSPKVEGRILQALAIKPHETVLEIGTGAGYLTALMAAQAKHVTTVEIDSAIAEKAKLALAKTANVSAVIGDAANGWDAKNNAKYDVIVFTGGLEISPESTKMQLNLGGRLFAVIGEPPAMQAVLVKRVDELSFKTDVLFETCLPHLVNCPAAKKFEF